MGLQSRGVIFLSKYLCLHQELLSILCSRKLSDEFRSCIGQEGFTFTDHTPGHDAAKCARLFLHYNEASVGGASSSVDPPVKRCKV